MKSSSETVSKIMSERIKMNDTSLYIDPNDFFRIAKEINDKKENDEKLKLYFVLKVIESKERFYFEMNVSLKAGEKFPDGSAVLQSDEYVFRIRTQNLRGKLFAAIDKGRKFMLEHTDGATLPYTIM